MYAQVVVLTYQAPDIDSFTYEIPKNLDIKIGQLVQVPFGKRNPQGVVIGLDNNKPIVPTKQISSVVLGTPILLPYQIKLLKWMSSYYAAPMVNCLETVLPKIPKRISKTQKPLANSQTVILVPSINRIPETLAKFPKAKNYIVYHNELKTSEKFSAWQKIISGEVDYIFGSRMAIFTPCPNLKEIIIYDEHDGAYKDERSPYYDTLTVAQKIAESTKAQIKIVDPSPKITTYFQIPSHIKIQTFTQKTKIVDLVKEKTSGNHSLLSTELQTSLEEALEKNQNILLFLNKKKESGSVFCKNCKSTSFLEREPNVCPNCNSADIFWNAANINALATQTKQLFAKANINLIFDKSKTFAKSAKNTVNIGTSFTIYQQSVEKFDLVAHILADSILNVADFNSAEKTYEQITILKRVLKPNGKLIIQTYNTQNPAINYAAESNYLEFYKKELEQKKLVDFPPFSLLIRLTIKGKDKQKIKKEADTFFRNLESSTKDKNIQLLGPYESIFWQKTPSYHIIAKCKLHRFSIEDRQRTVETFKSFVEIPRNWQAEVEPESMQ